MTKITKKTLTKLSNITTEIITTTIKTITFQKQKLQKILTMTDTIKQR